MHDELITSMVQLFKSPTENENTIMYKTIQCIEYLDNQKQLNLTRDDIEDITIKVIYKLAFPISNELAAFVNRVIKAYILNIFDLIDKKYKIRRRQSRYFLF